MDFFQMIDVLIGNPKYIWVTFSLLVFIIVVVSFVIAHFNKDHPFNLISLFAYDKDGSMSDSKARINAAFVITAWAFVFLTMNDKLTEWYVGVFLAAWVYDRKQSRELTQSKNTEAKETTTDK